MELAERGIRLRSRPGSVFLEIASVHGRAESKRLGKAELSRTVAQEGTFLVETMGSTSPSVTTVNERWGCKLRTPGPDSPAKTSGTSAPWTECRSNRRDGEGGKGKEHGAAASRYRKGLQAQTPPCGNWQTHVLRWPNLLRFNLLRHVQGLATRVARPGVGRAEGAAIPGMGRAFRSTHHSAFHHALAGIYTPQPLPGAARQAAPAV
jgi:hypothetical protein